MSTKKHMLSVEISEETLARLGKLAQREGIGIAPLVRVLLNEALDCCKR